MQPKTQGLTKAVVVFALVLVALVGGMALWKTKNTAAPIPAPMTRESSQQWHRIAASDDVASCADLTGTASQSACVLNIITSQALAKNDPSPCQDKKLDENAHRLCEQTVLSRRAVDRGTINICDEAPLREPCRLVWLNIVPVKEKDVKLCDTETDTAEHDNCVNNFTIKTMATDLGKVDIAKIDCARLMGKAGQDDCGTFKAALPGIRTEQDMGKKQQTCSAFKTRIFQDVCSRQSAFQPVK